MKRAKIQSKNEKKMHSEREREKERRNQQEETVNAVRVHEPINATKEMKKFYYCKHRVVYTQTFKPNE